MSGEKELRILLEFIENPVLPQTYFGKKGDFGSSGLISQVLHNFRDEKVLELNTKFKKDTHFRINVWSLKKGVDSFLCIVHKFLECSSEAEKLREEFLDHDFFWKGLEEYKDEIDLPLFLKIVHHKRDFRLSSFYEEKINQIIEKTRQEGFFIQCGEPDRRLYSFFEVIPDRIECPFMLRLTFSQKEISALRTLMMVSSTVTEEYVTRMIKGQSLKDVPCVDYRISTAVEELTKQFKAALWYILLQRLQDFYIRTYLPCKREAYEKFVTIFGTDLRFETKLDLEKPEEIPHYEWLPAEPDRVFRPPLNSFSCNGALDEYPFLKDLNQIDSYILYFLEYPLWE